MVGLVYNTAFIVMGTTMLMSVMTTRFASTMMACAKETMHVKSKAILVTG